MRNKEFKIGELYRSDVNGEIFEIIDIQKALDDKEYVHFKMHGSGKTSYRQLRTAQELLLTRIKEV